MNEFPDLQTWSDANQRYLALAMETVEHRITELIEGSVRVPGPRPGESRPVGPRRGESRPSGSRAARLATSRRDAPRAAAELEALREQMSPPPALETLVSLFGLSSFERDVLLLCAGTECKGEIASLCAKFHGDPQAVYPTFGLALSCFSDAHWSGLTPQRPLRRWRMVELSGGRTVATAALRLDESVLLYLLGIPELDSRLAGVVRGVEPPRALPHAHQRLADRIRRWWSDDEPESEPVEELVLELCGARAECRALLSHACASSSRRLFRMPSSSLPTGSDAALELLRLWEREALLTGALLVIELDPSDSHERIEHVTDFCERCLVQIAVSSSSPLPVGTRPRFRLDVPRTRPEERVTLWRLALQEHAGPLQESLPEISAQFNLDADGIFAAAHQLRFERVEPGADDASEGDARALWNACRLQGRPRLEGLAQRIEPRARWDDLVLPPLQKGILADMLAQVRQRSRVYGEWGFSRARERGLGITGLFAGPSGTGKTMAAEVIANELELDLFRIDLSTVVSKYIGETEANLRRIFDAADQGGAILLFDEADALFGKRSEVKDSHDRYANIEVSYLLQRMEAYRGIAVLTTNLKRSIDEAFTRRLRFIVTFPFPDKEQRAEIWSRIFPREAPTDGLDPQALSRLNVSGGSIHNIALNAAFLAARDGGAIQMSHVWAAARSEQVKLERSLGVRELGAPS